MRLAFARGTLLVAGLAVGCSYRHAIGTGDGGGGVGGAAGAGGAGAATVDGGTGGARDGGTAGTDGGGDHPTQLLANGVPCGGAAQCASNQCVDGVCCESACSGQCQACAEAGSAGSCVNVTGKPRGTVRAVCAGSSACAAQCNGSDNMACHYPGGEVQCADATCASGMAHPPSFCDRAGSCAMSAAVPCTSNQCADGTQCSGGCSAAQPCGNGMYCDATTKACLAQKQNGASCGADQECTSGACTDNVCCASRCSGQCQACAEPTKLGQCVTIMGTPRGTVRQACAGVGTCASRCDGTDATQCKYPGGTTQCTGASCSSGVSTAATVCNGSGACTAPTQTPCSSNQCSDAMHCSSGCSAALPCPNGQYCDSGAACQTVKPTGASCTADAQCASGACTDNVCCESRCSGQCQACAETGMAGKCLTVSGTPRGTMRTACAGTGTCASRCDGSDPTQCRFPGSTVQCTAQSCTAGAVKPASVCNGSGACTTPASMPCPSNLCADATTCSGGCSASQPCPGTQYCDPASKACLNLKANGTTCAADFECSSAACTDGVCCNSRCSGQCEACAETGKLGMCVAVGGAPRGNVRQPCAGTRDTCRGQCDGTTRTQCAYPTATTQCVAASCMNATLTTASVCNGLGDCTAQTTATCHSTQCLSTTQCLDNCSASAPCSGANYCDASGVCHPQIGSGACTANAQCLSGFCADGVCCNQACNDGCHGCNLPGTSGTCVSRFTEYSPIQGTAFESVPITAGPDGNMWFLEEGATGVSFMGRITPAGAISEFSIGSVERSFMASGADGTIWYEDSTDDPAPLILRTNTSGGAASNFVPQPDANGASWSSGFMLPDGTGTWVAQVDFNGVVSNQVVLLNAAHTIVRRINVPFSPFTMTKGSDGNLWLISPGSLTRIDGSNGVSQFTASIGGGLTSGPDGFLWFGESALNKIGRMSTSGVVTNEFPLPTPSSSPRSMVSGPGNLVWFTEITAPPRLARITQAGAVTECPLPDTPTGYGSDIAAGPDGAVWFTGIGASNRVKVYRYTP